MARLHRLVEDDQRTPLGAALEGLEVEPIAGGKALLLAPFALLVGIVGRRLDRRMGNAGLLIGREGPSKASPSKAASMVCFETASE